MLLWGPKKTGRKFFCFWLLFQNWNSCLSHLSLHPQSWPSPMGKRWLQYSMSATCAICSPSLSWLSLVALLELPMMGQSARSRPSAIPGQATKVLPKPGALCLKSGPKLKAARPLKEMAGYLNFQTFKPNHGLAQFNPRAQWAKEFFQKITKSQQLSQISMGQLSKPPAFHPDHPTYRFHHQFTISRRQVTTQSFEAKLKDQNSVWPLHPIPGWDSMTRWPEPQNSHSWKILRLLKCTLKHKMGLVSCHHLLSQ